LAGSAGLLQRADIPQNTKGVQLNQDTKLPLFYSLVESGFDQQSASLPEVKQGLEIQREYLDVTGKPLEQIKVGEEFLVRLRLRTVDKTYLSQVAVVDLLPGGVEPVINRVVLPTPERANPQNEEAAANEGDENAEGSGDEGEGDGEAVDDSGDEQAVADTAADSSGAAPAVNYIPGFSGEPGQSTWQAAFADLRDDRVVVYGHLTKDMVTFTYRVRATNTGSYQTPAAYAEAMYEPNLFARSLASKFKVVKP
jgi:uncharacterized protein YfaS (alpha-2-macroglobulin family)